MYAHDEACRPDEDRADAGAYCPNRSMVREPYDCIIGDAPIGAIPLGRVATVRGSLRRHAYAAMVEAMMSRRKSSAKPAGLSQLNLNASGIDVGATSHFVAVPADRAEQPVQKFAAFTADLYRLAEWLSEYGVETVVMESTGVYWIPLVGVLEERGFQVMLVAPADASRTYPGRKTDVLDCQWLQQLHTYGLLSGSFRPERGRTALAQLPAAASDAGGVRVPAYPAYAEGADPDEREAPARHQQHHRPDRHGHHRGHRGRRAGPPQAGAAAQLSDQGERDDHRQVVAGPLAGGVNGGGKVDHMGGSIVGLRLS